MSYPMPPELLEQLGLEARADADPSWPEDHDALGWGRRLAAAGDADKGELERPTDEEVRCGC